MKKNTTKLFLIITFVFLLASLTAINATDTNSTNNTQQQAISTNVETPTTFMAEKAAIKSDNTKNKTITKKQYTKQNTQKIDTLLTLQFIHDDEVVDDDIMTTSFYQENQLNIKLTEEETDTPINATITLHIFDDTEIKNITLPSSGQTTYSFTANKIGEQMQIYAEYEGNDKYYPTTSTILYIDIEPIKPTLTLEEIETQDINSTINITGKLYYNTDTPIEDATITVTLNEDKIADLITDTRGNYFKSYSLENLSPGNYSISIEYISQEEHFVNANTHSDFEIEKIENILFMEDLENIAVGTPVNITGSITNSYDQVINTKIKVNISLDGEEVYVNDSVLVEENTYSITFMPSKAGTYNITFNLSGDDIHSEMTVTKDITLEKASTNINLEESYESIVGENVSVTGIVVNENDDILPDVLVEISTDDTILGTVITDEEGKFNFTNYQFNEYSSDEFIIYFNIIETDDYESLYDYTYYRLIPRPLNFTFTADNHVIINQSLHFNGRIKDVLNQSRKVDGTIKIYINNQEKSTDISIDEDGTFTAKYDVGEEYVGINELSVYALFVPENQVTYMTKKSDTFNVSHDPIKSVLVINCNDTSVNRNIIIHIDLHDQFNNKIYDKVLLRITNNDTVEDIRSVDSNTDLIFSAMPAGNYTVFAEYSGLNDIYEGNISDNDFVVNKNNVNIFMDSLNDYYYVNDTIVIRGFVKDEYDNLLDTNISLEIITSNGTNRTLLNVSEGIFTTLYTPKSTSENTTLRLIFDESNSYFQQHLNDSFKVIKHEVKVIPDTIGKVFYDSDITFTGRVITLDGESNANGSVSLRINNETVATTILSNGSYSINYHVSTVGENNLTVIFNENEAYNTNTSRIKFNVTPLDTILTVNPVNDTIVNTTLTFNGLLTDENNKRIGGELTVRINNHSLDESVQVNSGEYSFTFRPDKAGEYTVNITYTGDNRHYNNSTTSLVFNALKAELIAENVLVKLDESSRNISITANLVTKANLTTENIKVIIMVNDEEYEIITGENGSFKVSTLQLIPDTYTIKLTVNQTEYYNEYNEELATITVEKITPTINIDPVNNSVYSQNTTINGNITDSYNNPLNNTLITIEYENTTLIITSDEEGRFNTSINMTRAGNTTVKVTVNKTILYNEKSETITFITNKQEAIIVLNNLPKIIPHENMNITGYLEDINYNRLAYKKVTIQVNNKKYTSHTDANGEFNLLIKKAKLGQYNITAIFADEYYNQTSTKQVVNVSKIVTHVIVEDINATVGDKILLKARIVDEDGNNVYGGNLVFKINGRSLRNDGRFDTDIAGVHKITVKDGYTEYFLYVDAYLKNAHNLTASYSGSYCYESAKSNTANVSIEYRKAVVNVTTTLYNKQHDNITLIAQVKDVTNDTNTSIASENASVIFKINGITLTDEHNRTILVPVVNNTATYNYSIGVMASVDIYENIRNYTVTAVYVSDNYDDKIENDTVFHVERSAVNIVDVENHVNDTSLSLKARLTDYMGYNLVGNNKVCIKINGITYKEDTINKYYTIHDGMLDISGINVENIKVESIEIVTGQRLAYLGARKTITDIVYE